MRIAKLYIPDIATTYVEDKELFEYLLHNSFNIYDITNMRQLPDIKIINLSTLLKAAEITAERFQPSDKKGIIIRNTIQFDNKHEISVNKNKNYESNSNFKRRRLNNDEINSMSKDELRKEILIFNKNAFS